MMHALTCLRISASSTPSAKVTIVDSIHDVRSWISSSLEGFHGHSGPHCFKFVRDSSEESRVLLYYRNWCIDAWCETKDALTILKDMPSGIPPTLQPSDQKVDVPRLQEDIPKYLPWLKQNAVGWWDNLDLRVIYSEGQNCSDWMLLDLEEAVVEQSSNEPLVRSERNPDLAALFTAETQSCKMYIGNYRPSSLTQVQAVQDLSSLEIGHLVAVYNEDKETEPWIGRVEEIFEENVKVVWMEGCYNKKWRVARIPDPSNRRKKIHWTDTISKTSIILYTFELTTTGILRKATVEHLQRAYKEQRQTMDS